MQGENSEGAQTPGQVPAPQTTLPAQNPKTGILEMMEVMPLEVSRVSLTRTWLIIGGLNFAVMVVASMGNAYGHSTNQAWGWFSSYVVPTISLMLGVLGAQAISVDTTNKVVKRYFHQMAVWVSIVFLSTLLLTVVTAAISPFRDPADPKNPMGAFSIANCWLQPLQGLTLAAIGVLFVTQNDKKHPQAPPIGADGSGQ